MKTKLHEYSLDKAGSDVEKLLIYENDAHLLVFCKCVIKYTRLRLRETSGLELFNFRDETEWIQFCRSVLEGLHKLDNDMALIVIAHEISFKIIEVSKNAPVARPVS
ncbi:MAG TPA: hypothetical protein VNX46_16285 [Candidatus Acidoferrum sp.]|nr:hypothetical protein [Candidatus Acidoferrum sp.]